MGQCLKGSKGGLIDRDDDLRRDTLANTYVNKHSEAGYQSMEVQQSEYGSRKFTPNMKAPNAPHNSVWTDMPLSSAGSVASTTRSFLPFASNSAPPDLNMSRSPDELIYDIPEGCRIVQDAIKVDILGTFKGLELWRSESDQFGLVLCKISHPSADNRTFDRETESGRGLVGEEYFENELRILSYVQVASQANVPKTASYRSKSPMKAGYEGIAYSKQHDNVIGFLGYMEAKIDLANADIVDRRLVTEFYVDSLRSHIFHRTNEGKREMKHFEAALYAFQMAKGLLSLHNLGISHRDLNPENVVMGLGLLDREYKEWLRYVAKEETKRTLETYAHLASSHRNGRSPDAQRQIQQLQAQKHSGQNIHYYKFLETQPLVAKLANLGNAKYVKKARSVTRIGAIQFMAPEMIRGDDYDVQCDIWSFGCVLYEMISGRMPFYKKTNSHIENKVLNGKFPRSDPIGNKSFNSLQTIMRNCLKTEPNLRCTAKDLVQDLGNL